MIDLTQRLQSWFARHCNGHWEHQHGVRIDTLDNPGWTIKIDLAGTPLQDRSFKEINTERSELNWLQCQVKDARFEGFGGPENLSEILGLFLDWSDTETTQAPDNKEGQDNSSAVRQ